MDDAMSTDKNNLPAAGSVAAWIMASRPPTLAAALIPVLVGVAVTFYFEGFRWAPSLAALWVAVWIQIGTNFANDVFDFEKGADTEERLGPTRAVQAGLLTPTQMRRGMVLAFALSFAAGCYLAWVAGWPLLVIGVISILSGLAYTGGPYPLGYHGLGDLFVFVFFGLVAVVGTVYVNLLELPTLAWVAALPVGALSTNILVVNNIRDRVTDRKAGKGTLVARFGRRLGLIEYLGMLALAFGVPAGLWLNGCFSPWMLLPWLCLPLALHLVRQLMHLEGPPLNGVLVGSARLLVIFGVLFAAGLTHGFLW